jgi:hypothetical protein
MLPAPLTTDTSSAVPVSATPCATRHNSLGVPVTLKIPRCLVDASVCHAARLLLPIVSEYAVAELAGVFLDRSLLSVRHGVALVYRENSLSLVDRMAAVNAAPARC